jgi:hypothetical protein
MKSVHEAARFEFVCALQGWIAVGLEWGRLCPPILTEYLLMQMVERREKP